MDNASDLRSAHVNEQIVRLESESVGNTGSAVIRDNLIHAHELTANDDGSLSFSKSRWPGNEPKSPRKTTNPSDIDGIQVGLWSLLYSCP